MCRQCGVNVQMISQGASKVREKEWVTKARCTNGKERVHKRPPLPAWVQVNISMVVDDAEALNLVRQLHLEFFERPLANGGASDPLGDVALHAPSSSVELR